MTKLNLGSGNSSIEGYTNVDVYPFEKVNVIHDIEKTLPFKDNSIEDIYCSHALEHCAMASVSIMLIDWYRVLVDGGRIRIIVPEINACMKVFLDALETDSSKWDWKIEYILGGQHHQVGQQFHKSAYTPTHLRNLVEKVGFVVDSLQIINNGLNDCIHLTAHKQ